jgi:hypothetical protein
LRFAERRQGWPESFSGRYLDENGVEKTLLSCQEISEVLSGMPSTDETGNAGGLRLFCFQ